MTDIERLRPLPDDYVETREALRKLACYVLSPARKAVVGRIGLRPTPGGLGTPPFGDDDEQLRVEGGDLFRHKGGSAASSPITSLSAAAAFAGVTISDNPGVGHDIPDLGDLDAPLPVSAAASFALGTFYRFSESALAEFRNELESSGRECSAIQLWPEHFDLAFDIKGVNFGFSPGDGYSPEPYVYVGPWNTEGLEGDFWNAPFGATLSYKELLDSDDQHGTALGFLRRGAGLALQRAGEEP